ncbi:STAS domain-containing protein [Halobacillus litoralis]|uniref:STAS domain-containing protein n=1 Tax=Halobacillus litoralis TaxID=45668 RepID=A0A845E4S7_9BACI|nr:STAS domain-containing protein [Halobacillus litoralis]MYL49683.1 STAS domain-containing protein [Halobacillus litoralis]
MREEITYIGEKIAKNSDNLANRVRELKTEEFGSATIRTANWEELFSYIGEVITGDGPSSMHHIEMWADREGEQKVEAEVELDQSLRTMNFVRRAIWGIFSEELSNDQFSSSTVVHICKTINEVLDEITKHFSQTYSRNIRLEWERKEMRMAELSVPVVPITKGVAVLPLIGEVDTNRAQLIMETSLNKSSEFELDYIFIDVSGVPVIDTLIANYIYQVVHALELVGVHATLTGLRPETAKSLVDMGVDFTHVHTKAGLHQALEEIGIYIHHGES